MTHWTIGLLALLGLAGCGDATRSGGSGAGDAALADLGGGGGAGSGDAAALDDGLPAADLGDAPGPVLDAAPDSDEGPGSDAGPSSDATPLDPCAAMPCGGPEVGTCFADGADFACKCAEDHEQRGGTCVPVVRCELDTCSGRGFCYEGDDGLRCECAAGAVGDRCEGCGGGWQASEDGSCRHACDAEPCGPPGSADCVPEGADFDCRCREGFHPQDGGCFFDDACEPDSCGSGDCEVRNGVMACECPEGQLGVRCETCADDMHFDDQGRCTADPCLPNPCAAGNQACRVVGDAAECFDPPCEADDPCVEAQVVGGECQLEPREDGLPCATTLCLHAQACRRGVCAGGAPVDCDDFDACTADRCAPAMGCVFEPAPGRVPEDGVPCTEDRCTDDGVAVHAPVDGVCDDGLFCSGVELCRPWAADADALGCVHVEVPRPPLSELACLSYGECREATQDFERFDDGCPRLHCGEITEDTVWVAGTVHLVTCDLYVEGEAGPTLRIEAGARVEVLSGVGIIVGPVASGRLVVEGGEDGVLFTVADGEAALPGAWKGLRFGPADLGSRLEDATVEWAGGPGLDDDAGFGAAVDVAGGNLTVVASEIRGAAGHGVHVTVGGRVAIRDSVLRDNRDDGLEATGGRLDAAFTGNLVTGNGRYPVAVSAIDAHRLDPSSDYTGNGDDVAWLAGGRLAEDATWQPLAVDYLLGSGFTVSDLAAPTLHWQDGVRVRMAAGIGVTIGAPEAGALVTEGEVLGVHLVSAAADAAPGDWAQLFIGANDTGSRLVGLEVAHGGGGDALGALHLHGSAPALEGIRVHDSGRHGLYVNTGARPSVTDSTFTDNAGDGVYVSGGGGLLRSGSSFQRNRMERNAEHPITLPADDLGELDTSSTYTGNAVDRVNVLPDQVEHSATWRHLPVDFLFAGGTSIRAATLEDARPEVQVEADTVLRFGPAATLVIGNSAPARFETAPGVRFTSADEQVPGAWRGLRFEDGAEDCRLMGATVEYAGGDTDTGAVEVLHSHLVISGSTVRDSETWGVFLWTGASASITDTRIEANGRGGLSLVGTARLGTEGVEPDFLRNVVTGNGGAPIDLPITQYHRLDPSSTFTGNATPFIESSGGIIDRSVRWQRLDSEVHVRSIIVVRGDGVEPTLTLDPGLVLRFDPNSGLHIGEGGPGALQLRGTVEAPVRLTTATDPPMAGTWNGLRLAAGCQADAGTLVEHAIIEYAGATSFGDVWFIDCDATLRDSHLAHSASTGVRRTRSNPTLENLTFEDNAGGDGI